VANPAARPEKVDTVEVNVERRIGSRLNLVTAAYGYKMHDFLVRVFTPSGLGQTQNSGVIHAKGFEMELQAKPTTWLDATASYAIQAADTDLANLPNSPQHLAKVHFALPLGRKFDLSSGMQYISSRETLDSASVKRAYLADFTISSRRLLANFDVRSGVRNAFNRNYSDPVALNPRFDTMQQSGRTLFVELIVHGAR
jgi:outer membrane receptor protein involved in Fe transport